MAVAEPYFDWLADQAENSSALNVVNRSAELFDRHRFNVDRYTAKRAEAEDHKDEIVRRKLKHGYTQEFFDELKTVRRQTRICDAHVSFGKHREAFSFPSPLAAVPLIMPHRTEQGSMRFGQGIDFVEHEAVELVDRFIQHLWSGARAPARIYI